MGTVMTLGEVVSQLDAFDEESTIYASEPWNENSRVIVTQEPQLGGQPKNVEDLGLRYFLEVFVAKDFLEGWMANLGRVATASEKTVRLIQYAVNDA